MIPPLWRLSAYAQGSSTVMIDLPRATAKYGFGNGPGGTHTSRTMMLAELRLLLATCPPAASFAEYRNAIVDENVLLKSTQTTRLRTLRGLRELYALDSSVLVFRALRDLWTADVEAQPLLALLCAVARDRLLRATSSVILTTPMGAAMTSQMLAEAVTEQLPNQYNASILNKVGRNAASSWTQSGHLKGRTKKVRAQAVSRPAALAYALLLGHLLDVRGDALFETLWTQLLDAPAHVLRDQAVAASRQGWMEYRHTGSVTEMTFRHLLRSQGQEAGA